MYLIINTDNPSSNIPEIDPRCSWWYRRIKILFRYENYINISSTYEGGRKRTWKKNKEKDSWASWIYLFTYKIDLLLQCWCNKHFKMWKRTSWGRVTATVLSLNSREAQVKGKSIWTVTHRMQLKGIERRWRKDVKDLSFLIPGGHSRAYSAVPQNIKVFSLGHFPIGKREPHPPILNMGN